MLPKLRQRARSNIEQMQFALSTVFQKTSMGPFLKNRIELVNNRVTTNGPPSLPEGRHVDHRRFMETQIVKGARCHNHSVPNILFSIGSDRVEKKKNMK